eukprot:TRINITY_DN1942_c0_g1_i1.p1 TRINITY_DN1942_c0_g1~~TRINITY_DN1942_c0_g1_i1.p1  ORF type:complete len:223 (+),score=58.92 TRINITY_DN1942_c0_g1_i1:151-819(+)
MSKTVTLAVLAVLAIVAPYYATAAPVCTAGQTVDIPLGELNQTNAGIDIPAFQLAPKNHWYNLQFNSKGDFTCINARVVVSHGATLQFCVNNFDCPNSPTCYDANKNAGMLLTAGVSFNLDLNSNYDVHFVIPGEKTYLGIYTVASDDANTTAALSQVFQYTCDNTFPVPSPPTGGTNKKSRGVSGGVAAFLFFLGIGVGVAAFIGVNYFMKKRESSGFIAM